MENAPEILGVIIVLAPLAIFLILMIVVRKSLRQHSIKLADLLVETDLPQPASAVDGDDATPTPVKRSASRFILFLSGITTLILSACFTTYYFYMKIYCINCQEGLDLEGFTNVLLALGLGVVPYAVNQVKKISL